MLLSILKVLLMVLHLKVEKLKISITNVGSGSFIPGFEEQVIGMKYEEQKISL